MTKVQKGKKLSANLIPGQRFSTCAGSDDEDQEVVTVLEVTPSLVLLESSGDWNGWRPLDLVVTAIAEASAQQSPRTRR